MFRSPEVNFINVLRAAFALTDPKSAKKTVKLSVFLRFWDLQAQKLLLEPWWNWHLLSPLSLSILDKENIGQKDRLAREKHFVKNPNLGFHSITILRKFW